MSSRGRPKHPDILTPREWEVLGHIREGRSNEQIAERLGISIDGVKYHVSEILGKLALDNRHDAARWAEGQESRPWPAGSRWRLPCSCLARRCCTRRFRASMWRWALGSQRGTSMRTALESPA
ncbi:MAG: response regulator transcription factor [Chloroflexi bacterium]|nr:response regulator transcription factor [Chloroflexota bacterium]